uniref:uncharacterized protein LOC122593332 n=1 Tax=Erigeron canadensis TaxID=72917 RepID=UPI001CB8C8F1|nr:uncharacterized protein LOC122593332 [Erigeron canadensis]
MSMLQLITKASSAEQKSSSDSQYPIVLNPDPAFLTLISQNQQPNNESHFLKPVQGWSLSKTDTEIIDLSQNFLKKLQIKLKNTNSFTKLEFVNILNSFLEKISQKVGIRISDIKLPENRDGYTKRLVEKLGSFMGEGALSLVIEGCVMFEIWDVLECLIVKGFVVGSCCKGLVSKLVEKGKPGLVCLCVKYVLDLELLDVLSVLKYFLSRTTKDGFGDVREGWEREAVMAIEMAADKSVGEKKMNLAKEAAVLLMMGHDGFTTSELCLHYLIVSPNVDDVIFAACVGKLNGLEIMGFVRYLKKWLVKYEKFPQACMTVKGGSSILGLKALESVPSIEAVTKCFGLVIDEHFSSLVMHPEFCEEMKSVEVVVNSLASEARFCCTLANLSASLKN